MLKKGFSSKLLYNEKYHWTKINSYKGKSSKHFHGHIMLKKGSLCIYLLVILISCILNILLLMLTFQMILIDDVEITDDSDEKNYDEEDSDKQNYSKE